MATIDKKTVQYLAKLCRIACTDEQVESLLHDMQKIIGYVELLDEVDTSGIENCNNVSEFISQAPLREDLIGKHISRDDFLANAPQQIGGMIRVPSVLKGG